MKDRLSASWVLVVGALLLGYYYWRKRASVTATAPLPSPPSESRPQGTPPFLPPVGPSDAKSPGNLFNWPREAAHAFEESGQGPHTGVKVDPGTSAWLKRGSLPFDWESQLSKEVNYG